MIIKDIDKIKNDVDFLVHLNLLETAELFINHEIRKIKEEINYDIDLKCIPLDDKQKCESREDRLQSCENIFEIVYYGNKIYNLKYQNLNNAKYFIGLSEKTSTLVVEDESDFKSQQS
jgi:hypothetical protein